MSIYGIVLFLHIVGALGLFAGMGLEQVSLARLRDAESPTQARDWLGVLSNLRRTDGPSGFLILATGFYMMATRWGRGTWMAIGVVGMVLMAAIAIAVTSRRARALKEAFAKADAVVWSAVRARLADPLMRMAATLRLAIGLGIVFNMAVKPATLGALASFGVALGAGALAAYAQWIGRNRAVSSQARSAQPTGR